MPKTPNVVVAIGDVIMSAMPYVNGVLGLIIVGYLVHRLLACPEQYNGKERLGMSLVAGGIVLATPALWMQGTPFDGWSFNVARAGIALYVITGGMRRDRHARRNQAAADQAAAYLAERNKL